MITATHNNGSNGEPEVPLWECPCRECWKMEQDIIADMGGHPDDIPARETLKEWAEARS